MRKETKKAPTIRFWGFTDDWEQRKLSEYLVTSTDKNYAGRFSRADVLSVSGELGIINQIEFQGRSFAGASVLNYGIVKTNDIVYTKSPLKVNPYGIIKANAGKSGIVSTLYAIYHPKKDTDSKFIECYFDSNDRLNHYLRPLVNKGAKNDMKVMNKDVLKGKVDFPPTMKEQRIIASFITEIEMTTALYKRKLDRLEKLKKYFLQNMFPAKGEKVPRIRFKGFTGDWEQRKLGELVIIERGGSPRPIDAYITEAQDGLNWVKIGDAPEQGRYITHTKEKIKPSGLSKTRQVFPGDLILSNSMSFGKPYIMGITGCIHDGWLLIRNNQNVFDLKFLCQMLGTKQMLVQYRRLAAGSTVNNLNKELVANAIVKVPETTEQEKIGAFLENLDNVITLHQRKLNQLLTMKKFMLQNLFI